MRSLDSTTAGVVMAERELQRVLESQWVRAVIAGLVVDVSVESASRGAIDIEILVLTPWDKLHE